MTFIPKDIIASEPNLPIITPQSVEGRELRRWDLPKSRGGMNRDGYEEYPKCLYKAGRPDHANVKVTGSKTVRDEQEERLALGQGWSVTQEAAIELVHKTHTEMGKLAAERAYVERRMSPKAQAEAAAFESETIQHVAEIPVQPIKRRPGRPKKAVE